MIGFISKGKLIIQERREDLLARYALIAIFAMLALFRLKLGMMKTIGCCAGLGVLYTAVRWAFT